MITDQVENITIRFSDIDLVYTKNLKKIQEKSIFDIDYRFLVITDQVENITIRFSDIDLVYTKNSKKIDFRYRLSIFGDH